MSNDGGHESGWRPGPIKKGQPQTRVHYEKIKGDAARAQNDKLKTLGERMKPPGHRYAGSIGIHIYVGEFDMRVAVITQNCCAGVGREAANSALQQASTEIAMSYGWKPPATRMDIARDDAGVKPTNVTELKPAAEPTKEPQHE